jgi:hypothetical protein
MGVFEGFCIGRYESPEAIKPEQRRLNFWNQICIWVDQKIDANIEYDEKHYRHTEFSRWGFGYDEIEENTLLNERFRHMHTCEDEFIQGIIMQRKEMIAKYRLNLSKARDKKMQEDLDEDMKKWKMCQDAMERTEKRERQREREQEKHRQRVDAANTEVQVYVYMRRKEREKQAKKEAQFNAAQKKWEEEQAAKKKENKKTLNAKKSS